MSTTKKEAILDTALKLFVENGIDATSIRAIAEGAETAEGNIYRHFESKNELAREIFLDCARQFRSQLENAVQQGSGPEEKIRILVRSIFEFSINRKLEFAYIHIVNHREEIITKEILSKPLPKDIFVDVLKEGMEQGIFRTMEPNIAVAWIVGMVQRSYIFLQRQITSLPKKELIDRTEDAVMRLIRS